MLVPGLPGALVARGGESVFRGSLFRTGYEIFYTPVPAAGEARGEIDHRRRLRSAGRRDRRRLVRAVAAAVRRTPVRRHADRRDRVLGAPRSIVARRLNRGYIHTLERSLLNRAHRARPVGRRGHHHAHGHAADAAVHPQPATTPRPCRRTRTRPIPLPIARSGGAARFSRCDRAIASVSRRCCSDEQGLPATLVPHVHSAAGVGSGGRRRGPRAAQEWPRSTSAS